MSESIQTSIEKRVNNTDMFGDQYKQVSRKLVTQKSVGNQYRRVLGKGITQMSESI